MAACASRFARGDGYEHSPRMLTSRSAATTRLVRSGTVSPVAIVAVCAAPRFLVLSATLRPRGRAEGPGPALPLGRPRGPDPAALSRAGWATLLGWRGWMKLVRKE